MAKPGTWECLPTPLYNENGIYENNLCHLFANADIIL